MNRDEGEICNKSTKAGGGSTATKKIKLRRSCVELKQGGANQVCLRLKVREARIDHKKLKKKTEFARGVFTKGEKKVSRKLRRTNKARGRKKH